mmetsp:Transcript_19358/g.40314  ORF Transcript_19358/g.40314 Transcript_19358/m.40314 type:complete len:215 (-) Transcript_19358:546-1190(-)
MAQILSFVLELPLASTLVNLIRARLPHLSLGNTVTLWAATTWATSPSRPSPSSTLALSGTASLVHAVPGLGQSMTSSAFSISQEAAARVPPPVKAIVPGTMKRRATSAWTSLSVYRTTRSSYALAGVSMTRDLTVDTASRGGTQSTTSSPTSGACGRLESSSPGSTRTWRATPTWRPHHAISTSRSSTRTPGSTSGSAALLSVVTSATPTSSGP